MQRNLTIFISGEMPDGMLENMVDALERIYGIVSKVGGRFDLPSGSYDASRDQYLTYPIFDHLDKLFKGHNHLLLGIINEDLFVPEMNYVFGQASKKRDIALVSLKRLSPDFMSGSDDNQKFYERGVKEAVHEVGHLLGIGHCSDSRCVMFFSNCLEDTDHKGVELCKGCEMRL